MTAPKHTPGPWVAHSRPDGSEYGHHVTTAGGLTVCAVAYQLPTSEAGVVVERERIANARLIAAAPELLEALLAAVECGMVPKSSAREGGANAHARQARVADMIRDAIAKATGETA